MGPLAPFRSGSGRRRILSIVQRLRVGCGGVYRVGVYRVGRVGAESEGIGIGALARQSVCVYVCMYGAGGRCYNKNKRQRTQNADCRRNK